MGKFIELLSGLSTAGIVVFIIVLVVFAVAVVSYIRRLNRGNMYNPSPASKPEDTTPPPTDTEAAPIRKTTLGTGLVKCVAFRPGNILDFTTIPAPIGEIYIVDTSCPQSGASCIVREDEHGKVVDYDPREVPVVIEQTPEYAWFATHWDIVDRVFSLPLAWWRSTSTWFAAGMMAIIFILGLAVLGD